MNAKAEYIKIIIQAHYDYHDIISLRNFESMFSKIDQKQTLIKRVDNYKRICSAIAPLYWTVRLLVLQVGILKKGVEINT